MPSVWRRFEVRAHDVRHFGDFPRDILVSAQVAHKY